MPPNDKWQMANEKWQIALAIAAAVMCCTAGTRGQQEQSAKDATVTAEQRAAWLEADQKLPQALPDKDLVALIDMLDDDDFEVREAGTTALMLRQDFDDIHMVGALRGATSPEMRHRLTEVAMHRYFQRINPGQGGPIPDSGSLGVDIEPRNIVRPDQYAQLKHPAMLISKTKPGFPAFALLRSGDMIIAIAGKPFPDDLDQATFIAMIQEYNPGEVMQLTVLRRGKEVSVPVRLDSRHRLEQVHQRIMDVADPAMYAPWQVYLANMLDADDPDPVIRIDYPERQPAPAPAAN